MKEIQPTRRIDEPYKRFQGHGQGHQNEHEHKKWHAQFEAIP